MPAAAAALRRAHILLVDDNDADTHLTITALRDAHVHNDIHVTRDGEEALAYLRRSANNSDTPRPDIVLLDLNMPKLNGFDVLIAMKADSRLRAIPVIVISGSESDADRARAYELQAAGYLVKPTSPNEYFTAIRAIKEVWLHILSSPPKYSDEND